MCGYILSHCAKASHCFNTKLLKLVCWINEAVTFSHFQCVCQRGTNRLGIVVTASRCWIQQYCRIANLVHGLCFFINCIRKQFADFMMLFPIVDKNSEICLKKKYFELPSAAFSFRFCLLLETPWIKDVVPI